jgi:hypothetical protein
MSNSNLDSEIYNIEFVESYVQNKELSAYNVHIKVYEDEEWIGDFFVEFVEGPKRMGDSNETVYVADWENVKKGNGLYVEESPPFWPVEDAEQSLNAKQFSPVRSNHSFKSINSGPNDI